MMKICNSDDITFQQSSTDGLRKGYVITLRHSMWFNYLSKTKCQLKHIGKNTSHERNEPLSIEASSANSITEYPLWTF